MRIFLDKIIKPVIVKNNYTEICEIGASCGHSSDKLLTIKTAHLSIIDPCLDLDLENKYKNDTRVTFYKGPSLKKLPILSRPCDCFLIDGDHNWYTVYNELRIIHEKNLLKEGGAIFFHDVSWPYDRRDMYHVPESIPEDFRHPYKQEGIRHGQSALCPKASFNKSYYNALTEGGPQNGVLTAIEDFMKEMEGEYSFFYFKIEFGLGVLVKDRKMTAQKMFPGLYHWIKCYEIIDKLPSYIRSEHPKLYNHAAKIARKFNIKRL